MSRHSQCDRCKKVLDYEKEPDRTSHESFVMNGNSDEIFDLCGTCGPLFWQFMRGEVLQF